MQFYWKLRLHRIHLMKTLLIQCHRTILLTEEEVAIQIKLPWINVHSFSRGKNPPSFSTKKKPTVFFMVKKWGGGVLKTRCRYCLGDALGFRVHRSFCIIYIYGTCISHTMKVKNRMINVLCSQFGWRGTPHSIPTSKPCYNFRSDPILSTRRNQQDFFPHFIQGSQGHEASLWKPMFASCSKWDISMLGYMQLLGCVPFIFIFYNSRFSGGI